MDRVYAVGRTRFNGIFCVGIMGHRVRVVPCGRWHHSNACQPAFTDPNFTKCPTAYGDFARFGYVLIHSDVHPCDPPNAPDADCISIAFNDLPVGTWPGTNVTESLQRFVALAMGGFGLWWR